MHYLTNYYKNLSEQLQEKVNFLEAQLKEGRYVIDPETGKGKIIPDPAMMPERDSSIPYIPYLPAPKPDPRIKTETKPSKPGISIGTFGRDERNPKNPWGPPIGREGEEGSWEMDRKLVGPNYKPQDRWIPGKRKPAIDKSTGKPIDLFLNKNPNSKTRPETPILPERKPLIGQVPGLGDTDAIDIMPEPKRDEINITPEFGSKGPYRSSDFYNFLNKGSKSTIPSIPAKETPYYGGSDKTLSQSEVDDEGKPTGLVRVTPKPLKVKRIDGSGPKIPPAPRERPNMG